MPFVADRATRRSISSRLRSLATMTYPRFCFTTTVTKLLTRNIIAPCSTSTVRLSSFHSSPSQAIVVVDKTLHRRTPQHHHNRYNSTTLASFHSTPVINMGFTKEVIKQGNGQKPQRGQTVTVHCTGYGKNRDLSQKFWSTKDPGQQPFSFQVATGSVIKGWDESVIDMSIGEVAKIHCSPDYAYGAGGFPAWGIMPNSELVFEIEVLSFK